MILNVAGTSEGGVTHRGDARVTREDVVEVRVDGLLMFCVPEPDWGLFCEAMLGSSTLPPALAAPRWATHGFGAASLDVGGRLAVLHALLHLAGALPLAALFQAAPFGPDRVAALLLGRRLLDGLGNLLYVPGADVQARLAARRDEREALLGAGCLFEADVLDGQGGDAMFFFRPYRLAPARPEWPQTLRELREAIEEARDAAPSAR